MHTVKSIEMADFVKILVWFFKYGFIMLLTIFLATENLGYITYTIYFLLQSQHLYIQARYTRCCKWGETESIHASLTVEVTTTCKIGWGGTSGMKETLI